MIVDETHTFARARFEAAAAALASPGGGRPQYWTSMHYPDCPGARCSGCLPSVLEGEVVEPWIGPDVWDRAAAAYAGDQAEVFALVRDGIARVHVPEVR